MNALVQEVAYLRGLVNRLLAWRQDLKYQKTYLSLKVQDLLASHRATMTFIHGMGIPEEENRQKPIAKLKRCANAVIAVYRMKSLAHAWQTFMKSGF
jgi:hypothetical protein